jgi:hypothetical protein
LPTKNESSADLQSSSSNDKLLEFEWPEQIFYYLNEELANLNRQLVNNFTNQQQQASSNGIDVQNEFRDDATFKNIFNLLRVFVILSKYLIF